MGDREGATELITTELDWSDLALSISTLDQLRELEAKNRAADSGRGGAHRPGDRCLFHGPPGTGKTLATVLIGKRTKSDVYRIDLSAIVSKYIGETEKNLGRALDRAEKVDGILFFDEADALFGRRTAVVDGHDRYANLEVSHLLQRLERFSGVVVVATNHPDALDDAVRRRFDFVVRFPDADRAAR